MQDLGTFTRPDLDQLPGIQQIVLAMGKQEPVGNPGHERVFEKSPEGPGLGRQAVDPDGPAAVELDVEIGWGMTQSRFDAAKRAIEIVVESPDLRMRERAGDNDGAIVIERINEPIGIRCGFDPFQCPGHVPLPTQVEGHKMLPSVGVPLLPPILAVYQLTKPAVDRSPRKYIPGT